MPVQVEVAAVEQGEVGVGAEEGLGPEGGVEGVQTMAKMTPMGAQVVVQVADAVVDAGLGEGEGVHNHHNHHHVGRLPLLTTYWTRISSSVGPFSPLRRPTLNLVEPR